MPTENFKSKAGYDRWNAYRHIHGIAAPHLKEVCIQGKCHKVQHSELSKRKMGSGNKSKMKHGSKPARRKKP